MLLTFEAATVLLEFNLKERLSTVRFAKNGFLVLTILCAVQTAVWSAEMQDRSEDNFVSILREYADNVLEYGRDVFAGDFSNVGLLGQVAKDTRIGFLPIMSEIATKANKTQVIDSTADILFDSDVMTKLGNAGETAKNTFKAELGISYDGQIGGRKTVKDVLNPAIDSAQSRMINREADKILAEFIAKEIAGSLETVHLGNSMWHQKL